MSEAAQPKKVDRIPKPARRWRNWYLPLVTYTQNVTGRACYVGVPHPGSKVWPSKEVAEQIALTCDDGLSKYLGARPEQ